MMKGCNIRTAFPWLFIVIILCLTSCSRHQRAPIVNGWKQPAASKSGYIVQKGDTLYSIAWAFDMDFRDLARINHLSPPYGLNAGQTLQMTLHPLKPATRYALTKLKPQTVKSTTKSTKTTTIAANNISTVNTPVNSWLWPAKGRVLKGFSPKITGNRGIDIVGQSGEPVVASAAGKVVYAGSALRGYGNLLIVKHNDTFLSAYAYNKALLVKEGSSVKAGQTIAWMGTNDGRSILHFEIRRNGKPIDPLLLLKGNPKG